MNFGGGGFGMGGGLGKSNAKEIKGEETGVTFKDVAGQDEAKESLQEIVSFLKNPEKYNEIGARCPRGALLVGPPGTGKTLLAKAVAGEAGVTFFQIAGSAFVEMFVGRGAAQGARPSSSRQTRRPPASSSSTRSTPWASDATPPLNSNDEREQTRSARPCMDGFDNHKGIVVLAATNRPETLDQALLRPGRFDRRIPVELPDLVGREAILKIHANDVKMEPGIDLGVVARSHARRLGRGPRQHHQRGRAARRALRAQARDAGGPARVRRRGHRRREEEVHRPLRPRERRSSPTTRRGTPSWRPCRRARRPSPRSPSCRAPRARSASRCRSRRTSTSSPRARRPRTRSPCSAAAARPRSSSSTR